MTWHGTDFLRDLRYASRLWFKDPGFSLTLVLVLGIGIGCATVMFSVLDTILLGPLPFPNADRIVNIGGAGDSVFEDRLAYWGRSRTVQGLAIYGVTDLVSIRDGAANRMPVAVVSSGFFDLLGVKPAFGRLFSPDDEKANTVAVLTQGFWNRSFGRRPDVVGQALRIQDTNYTVIGVLPAEFQFRGSPDVYLARRSGYGPRPGIPSELQASGSLLGLLQPGTSQAQAQAEFELLLRQEAETASARTGMRMGIGMISVRPLRELLVGSLRPRLLSLSLAALFVLLIACANAANLLLARGAARQREIATRLCLGAGRSKILRQLLAETAPLAVVGGLAGVGIAVAAVKALPLATALQYSGAREIGLNTSVLTFSVVLSILTGVVVGIMPAAQVFATDLSTMLKAGGTATAGVVRRRLRNALVVTELAAGLLLLVGAVHSVQALARLAGTDPGFDTKSLLTTEVILPAARYKTPAQVSDFQSEMVDRLRTPSILSAGFSSGLPLSGKGWGGWSIHFKGKHRITLFSFVSADYLHTLGIPMLRGRPFVKSDTATSQPVVILNRALARLLGPEGEVLGKEFEVEGQKKRVIVGIIEDARFKGLGDPPEPQFYLPYSQNPRVPLRFNLVMRQAAAAGPADSELRQALLAVDRNAAVLPVTSMDSVVQDSLAPPRLRTVLLGTSTIAALALALLGVYGLMSYVAATRRRELALRLAMGARPLHIIFLVEKEALKLTAAGLVIGLLAGAGLAEVMSVKLLEAQPLDTTGVLFAALLMACCALAASFFPALRASKLAPMDALRHE